MSKTIAIYIRRNTVNGKEYVGQSVDSPRRWREEFYGKSAIGGALRKYGAGSFENTILFWVDTQELANWWETSLIDHRKTLAPCGYNIRDGGSNGYSLAGKSEAEREVIRQKQSESGKRRGPASDETRRKASESKQGEKNPMYGRKHRGETLEKMSELGKGRKHTAETRGKQSESRQGEKNPFYGRRHSAETLRRMSESKKRSNKRRRKEQEKG